MITLLINSVVNSELLQVLGIISGILESAAGILIIVAKVITILKAKDMTTKEKLDALDKTKGDK